jgi:hypothetical protein
LVLGKTIGENYFIQKPIKNEKLIRSLTLIIDKEEEEEEE